MNSTFVYEVLSYELFRLEGNSSGVCASFTLQSVFAHLFVLIHCCTVDFRMVGHMAAVNVKWRGVIV